MIADNCIYYRKDVTVIEEYATSTSVACRASVKRSDIAHKVRLERKCGNNSKE